ncbi:MAG TPA: glycosyltransferase family A protein [Vicinamibacterales bacterium]|nr:glycosyltransferase family A protein [Vicinamibacterales bacterium]
MRDDPTPAVSVVVPTYNRDCALAGCLDALARQSVDPRRFEVVVIDDGSTDGTTDVCRQQAPRFARFTTHRQANRGPAAARNAGIRMARAPLVAFTDDDCVPPPDWLHRILDRFASEPDLGGLGGLMITPPHQWVPLTHHSDLTAPGTSDYSRFIGTNNAAYRRDILLQVGGFDEAFRHVSVEDAELYIRIRRVAHTAIDPDLYVSHPPRLMGFGEAIRGYVRFYEGYAALEERYPDDFRDLYGSTAAGAVLGGRSWRTRARLYLPGMVRHPWRGVQFIAYLVCSRLAVMARAIRRRRTAR